MGAMKNEDNINGGQKDTFDLCYVVTRVLVFFLLFAFIHLLTDFPLQ